jgi:hypothetical protein
MLISTREGQLHDLQKIFNEPYIMKLFSNDYEPGYLSDAQAFIEPKGYQFQIIKVDKWKYSLETGRPIAEYPKLFFTFSKEGTLVYGFFVMNEKGIVKHAERFPDGPYSILRVGDVISVTLKIGLGDNGYRR